MTLAFISHLSYFVLFVLMIVEGPVVTSAAAFAVHLGFFTLPKIFLLSILGDLVGDVIYYGAGYASRGVLIDRHGHRFGLNPELIARFDRAFRKHRIKSLIVAKLVPAIPGPVLVAAGALRLNFWTLVWVSIVLAVPKYALFMILGYVFGSFYVTFFHYYDIVGWILVAVLIIGSFILYKSGLKAVLRGSEDE